MLYDDLDDFPTDLPGKEVKAVIDIVRNGTQDVYKRKLAQAGWKIVGYGLGLTVFDATLVGVASPCPCDDETCGLVNDLATTLGVSTSVATVCDSPLTAITVWDPKLWAEIIRLVVEILRNLPKD